MIVQRAAAGSPILFAVTNGQHTALAGQSAEIFGNPLFAAPRPREAVLDLVYHHDDGWLEIDENPPLATETGLPYSLEQTPPQVSLPTINRSPQINEARGPLQGLLASMHMWGIYTGRYGLVEQMDLTAFSAREELQQRLDAELERQRRLKALAKSAAAPWAEPEQLMGNYRLLQFFDMLSLYFNRNPAGERGTASFRRVPKVPGGEATITVSELPSGEYRIEPFPFALAPVEVYCEGRNLQAGRGRGSGREVMESAPVERQTYLLTGDLPAA